MLLYYGSTEHLPYQFQGRPLCIRRSRSHRDRAFRGADPGRACFCGQHLLEFRGKGSGGGQVKPFTAGNLVIRALFFTASFTLEKNFIFFYTPGCRTLAGT
jgi:hypothetical protein